MARIRQILRFSTRRTRTIAGSRDSERRISDFESTLMRELRQAGERQLRDWLRESERDLKHSMTQWQRQMETGALSGGAGNDTLGVRASGLGLGLAGGLGTLFGELFRGIGRNTKTSVQASETQRSLLSESGFRESRSQQAARAAREVARAQRNR